MRAGSAKALPARMHRFEIPAHTQVAGRAAGQMKIGFVTDIHEDVESLSDAFTLLEEAGCDVFVCLGDIVGFTLPFQKNISMRDANASVDLVADRCHTVVTGNHDLYAVRRCPTFNAGFPYSEDWYQLDYEHRAKLSRRRIWLYEDSELPVRLTARASAYLGGLPEYAVCTFDGVRILLSHFCFPDPSGSTVRLPKSKRDLRQHFQLMATNDCMIAFSGHGHPEGSIFAGPKSFAFRAFGEYSVDTNPQWIVCPCVANTSRKNGVLVYDTSSSAVRVIPLGSRKKHV